MATNTYEPERLTLIDGTVIEVRPLRVSLLKPFMKKFEGVQAVAEDNEKSMNILMECVAIAMKQYSPELAADPARLEDVLDLPTVYRIVEAASGTSVSGASTIA